MLVGYGVSIHCIRDAPSHTERYEAVQDFPVNDTIRFCPRDSVRNPLKRRRESIEWINFIESKKQVQLLQTVSQSGIS